MRSFAEVNMSPIPWHIKEIIISSSKHDFPVKIYPTMTCHSHKIMINNSYLSSFHHWFLFTQCGHYSLFNNDMVPTDMGDSRH